MLSVFGGAAWPIGAILAKLRPPTPASTQPITYTVTQPTTTTTIAPGRIRPRGSNLKPIGFCSS